MARHSLESRRCPLAHYVDLCDRTDRLFTLVCNIALLPILRHMETKRFMNSHIDIIENRRGSLFRMQFICVGKEAIFYVLVIERYLYSSHKALYTQIIPYNVH